MVSFSIDKQSGKVNAEWMSRPVDSIKNQTKNQPLALVLISMEQSPIFAYRLKRKFSNGPIIGGAYTVGITYNASGLKLEQTPEHVGLGWSLSGIGRISREVRGLPDDFNGTSNPDDELLVVDERRGWLRTMEGTIDPPAKYVGDFIPTSDLLESTCNDELSDYNQFVYQPADTEPDIFHFSVQGLTGSFVFDNAAAPQIRLIPYQDIKISYSVSHSTKQIIAFTVQTNQGTTYHFDRPVAEEFSITPLGNFEQEYFNRYSKLNYNTVEMQGQSQYVGHVKYNSEWMLTKISSVIGSEITFTYSENPFEILDTLKVGLRKDDLAELKELPVHKTYKKIEEQRVNSIASSTGQRVEFHYMDSLVRRIQVIDQRRSDNTLVKEFIFTHQEIINTADALSKRHFLASVQEKSGDISLPPFEFTYTGVSFLSNQTRLPSHDSNAQDFWGYYNGKSSNISLFPRLYVYPALDYPDKVRITPIPSYTGEAITLPGVDRTPDPVLMEIGSLNKIRYPLGGSLHIDYEPNTYYDATADLTLMGGGLRVRSLAFFDGINPSNAISKDFIYEEGPSKSSGRLLAFPVFYIPTTKYVFNSESGSTITKTYNDLLSGSSAELWDRLVVRTEESLAYESSVRYKKITAKKQGSGWTTVEYELPSMAGDLTFGDWAATLNKFARYSSCEPMGIFPMGGAWRYPYTYNPNYHHERRNPFKTSNYDEAGRLIKETTYTYQYLYKEGTAPFKVWGLHFEKLPNQDAYAFGKYFLLTDVVKVPLGVTTTTYDELSTAKSTSQTIEYLYESSVHKLLTGTRSTNSNGTVYTNRVRYPLDFGTIPSTTDKAAAMISQLQSDYRNGTPIETYQTIQKQGGAEMVTTASLVTFNDFGGSTPLVESTYSLKTSEPLTYSINNSDPTYFAPATVQLIDGEYQLKVHDAYEKESEITGYAFSYKIPITFNDPVNKVIGGTVLGFDNSVPVAEVKYATPDQIAFSDFETESSRSFEALRLILGKGRTGINAMHPSISLSKVITKGSSTSYILTFWIKTDGTPTDFDVIIKDASLLTTLDNFPFTANSSTPFVFTRIRRSIDVSSYPATFSVEIRCQACDKPSESSASLLPVVDDVAFYPEQAELTTRTFNIPWGATSVTDYTGMTSYQEYDGAGRHSLTLDKNKNIKIKNKYALTSGPDVLTGTYDIQYHSATLSSENLQPPRINVEPNVPMRFIADEQSHENVTYEWDFGFGFVTGTRSMQQTFGSGIHNVTLRVSKTGYPTVTSSTISVHVIGSLTICAKGVKDYNPVTNSVNSFFTDCNLVSGTIPSMATAFGAGSEFSGTFKWKIRDIGSSYWTSLGSDLQQVQIDNINSRDVSFEVICEIWNGSDLTARSNIIQVVFSYK